MGRRSRPTWGKVTITVQQETAKRIRVSAAELGCEMGTFVDGVLQEHFARVDSPSKPVVLEPKPTWLANAFKACQGDRFRIAMLIYGEAVAGNPGGGSFSALPFLGDRDNELFQETLESVALQVLDAALFHVQAVERQSWDEAAALQFDSVLRGVDALFSELVSSSLVVSDVLKCVTVIEGMGIALGLLMQLGAWEVDPDEPPLPPEEAAKCIVMALCAIYEGDPDIFVVSGAVNNGETWGSRIHMASRKFAGALSLDGQTTSPVEDF